MPGLRFDRLFTLTCLILLLVSPSAALADPIADADKPLPNMATGNLPAEADSKSTGKPAGFDPEAAPVPLRGAMPAASDTAGETTLRNRTVESSQQAGGLTPALVPGPVPTGTTDQSVTDAATAGMQTPTPPAATPNEPAVQSSAVVATPAPAATAGSEQPSPAAVATPVAATRPDPPVGEPSPAVAGTPVSTPTSHSEQSAVAP